MKKEEIIQVLKGIKYPGQGKDLYSLGLVRDIEIEPDQVRITLKQDRANDPFSKSVDKVIKNSIQEKYNNKFKVDIIRERPKKEAATAKKSPLTRIDNIIAVASGKGGVGKSTVAVNLAVALARQGIKAGLIDADIYGPSIPKMFNVEDIKPIARRDGEDEWIVPVEQYGVKLLSVGFFVDAKSALIWRGPMATSALKQLVHQGEWGELEYLIIDLPPGTSDIHITLVQEVAVTGAIIVSTPQKVALADAIKGINMFRGDKINVPVLGLVENMAWFTPDEMGDKKYYIFGRDGVKQLAEEMRVPFLGQIPIVESICRDGDEGTPSALHDDTIIGKAFKDLAASVVKAIQERNNSGYPTQRVKISTH